MRRDRLGLLACPDCKGPLEAHVAEGDGEEMMSGILRCVACDFDFPVEAGIPNLLPREFHRDEVG